MMSSAFNSKALVPFTCKLLLVLYACMHASYIFHLVFWPLYCAHGHTMVPALHACSQAKLMCRLKCKSIICTYNPEYHGYYGVYRHTFISSRPCQVFLEETKLIKSCNTMYLYASFHKIIASRHNTIGLHNELGASCEYSEGMLVACNADYPSHY